jgi:Uma2 family endonuclease
MTRQATAQKKLMTPEEYLAFERASPEKHEYYRGEIFAMAGGSEQHSAISANVIGELYGALRHPPCRVYTSDLRVKVPATGLYTYPDASVVCGGPEFHDEHRDTLLNPRVIFEVLSPSTESYDRGEKFDNYASIPSLVDYVLVSQDEKLVEHYTRRPDGWLLRRLRGGETLHLASIGCEIAVNDLYSRVFEAPETAGQE